MTALLSLGMARPFTDPVLVFACLMLLLLVAPALSARLRVPAVVGLIAAGAVCGPSALNLLTRSETIQTLGQVGLLYLMFLAGLSLDLQQFVALRARSLAFGLVSFGIPQLLGIGAALWVLDWGLLPALLLGSIVGTHTLIAYPMAQRLGLGRHPAVIMVAGATLITDGLGLAVLAAVAAAKSGALGLMFWLLFALKLVVFVTVTLVVLPRLGRWFFRRAQPSPQTELVFLLLLLFGTAYLSQLAGLAPIVGAFLAGLTLNRMVPNASGIMSRVNFVGEALFVPLFLVSVGLLVDFGVLVEGWTVWFLALVFTLAVVVGKAAAALLARRVYGHSSAAGWVVIGLSTPQAAGTLAVTLVGFEIGLFEAVAVNAVVVLILVSCLFGPWLVDRFGRQLALELADSDGHDAEASARILIPLANPATAGSLVDLATLLRPQDAPDPIYPLIVVRDGDKVREQVARNERIMADAVSHAVAAGTPVNPVTRIDLNVVHAIVRAQKELRASTVVIGWSGGLSAGERIFGGVLDQLLEQCDQTIVVSRLAQPLNSTAGVVVFVSALAHRQPGFDGAVQGIKSLCQRLGARLILLVASDDAEAVERRVKSARPEVPLELRTIDAEEALHAPGAVIGPRVHGHDLLVVLGGRVDSLAWRPAMRRFPGQLAVELPDHNLLVVHPAQESLDEDEVEELLPAIDPTEPAATRSGTGRLFRTRELEWAAMHHAAEPLRDFLDHMLQAAPDLAPEGREELVRQLLECARTAPIEVRAGVLFLRARGNDQWREPHVFVGTCEDGITAPGVGSASRVILALVSPEQVAPAQHLDHLAVIARAFLEYDSVERLSAVHTVAELRALMDEAAGGGAG